MAKEDGGILRAAVPLVIDGREYQLRYRAYSFIRYAEELNRDLLTDLKEVGPALQMNLEAGIATVFVKLRDLIWAGLVDLQPDITRDDVSRMIDVATMGDVLQVVLEAIRKTMPEPTANPTLAAVTKGPRRQSSPPTDGVKSGVSSVPA